MLEVTVLMALEGKDARSDSSASSLCHITEERGPDLARLSASRLLGSSLESLGRG